MAWWTAFAMQLHTSHALMAAVGVCAVVGAVYLGQLLASFLAVLLQVYLVPGISLARFGAGQGAWALVTGCTDGIGREFARQLARRGFNVVLVSRSQAKLDALAAEIQEHCPEAAAITLAVDFAAASDEDYARIAAATRDLDVAVLVNNVGVNSDIPVEFVEEGAARVDAMLAVNVAATVRLTHIFAARMRTARRGLILNLGSAAGLSPTPLLATYSASKAFVSTFSTALGAELAPAGVIVQCVPAFFVVSAMSKIRRPSWMTPTARTFVQAVLDKVGVQGGAARPFHSLAYAGHAFASWLIERFGSHRLQLKINLDMHRHIRARALKKRARETKTQ
jgi:17beta-estradiol 17-dehydrogenase / very-long-chain 3-oxoacyl-CoA reductase